jgi:Ner family transcriptional regulator
MHANWTRQRILFELRERGTSAAELADQHELTRFTVYSAMERPYPKVQRLIAAALDVGCETIWPQFYRADGSRRRIRRESSQARAA